jgi:putative hydrolase of the HAD superfamily
MTKVKAVIFDFYGVIRSDEYHNWLDVHQIDIDETRSSNLDLDLGKISMDEFFEELSKISGIEASKIKKEFLSNASLNEGLLSLILELKDKYKLAILSNASSSHIRDILKKAGLYKLFDEIIISSEIGYIKPDSKIFEYALEKLAVKPQQTIFIDDNQRFVDAASDIGIESICYTDLNSLKNSLKQMGIISN